MYASAAILALAFSAVSGVSAHGVFVATTGATNGKTGQAFGVDASTPRDGSTRKPFEQDTSIIRDKDVASGKATTCGRTIEGGANDIATSLSAAESAGLPDIGADGSVKMTLHQVNGDGAGPYTCGVSTDATGQTFIEMEVITNVPGKNSRSKAKATDFPVLAKLPAGTSCTGGTDGKTCLVRCANGAKAGPFGGCMAFTQATGAAAGNVTASNTATANTATANTATANTGTNNTTLTNTATNNAASNATNNATNNAKTAAAETKKGKTNRRMLPVVRFSRH